MQLFGDDPTLAKVKSPAVLPKLCVRCGSAEHLEQVNGSLTYLNPSTYFWIVFPVILLIAYLIFRKTLKIEYSLCSTCAEHIKKWESIETRSSIVCAILFLLVLLLPDKFTRYFAVLVLLSFAFAFYCSTKKSNGLSVKKYFNEFYYVRGVPKGDAQTVAKSQLPDAL